ncbi:MAG: type IV pilus assembly protein FimV [Thiobacillus sp.]
MNLKSVCLLLSLCHVGYAAAFGLGEINVRSYLGQPLHATVPILDASPNTTAECFSLGAGTGSISPPQHAQLKVEQAGKQTVLHIRTLQPIHDPIAQFELVSDCGSRLQREYAVLLDPPARVDSAVIHEESTSAPTAAVVDITPVVPRAHNRPRRANRSAAISTHASAAASRQSATHDRHPAASAAVPRLVLSGKRSGFSNGSLALQYDINLPDMNRKLPEGLTAAESSDEYTALTHKLAHLETQLVELQQKNAVLEAKDAAAPVTVTRKPTDDPAQWPMYLLIIGLLTGGGALIALLRRRSNNQRLTGVWVPPSEPTPPIPDPMESDPWALPLPSKTAIPTASQRMSEIAAPPPIGTTEVKDDILDQAEVYMAHGHGELAVHLLQEHVRNAPDESPVPWLLLLDLLHRDGDTAGYKTASAECRRHFNINLTGHPISQNSDTNIGLEAYPHLLEQLTTIWGTPSTDDFFRDLLYDNRGGTRVGFEPGAYRDILLLRTIAQNVMALPV